MRRFYQTRVPLPTLPSGRSRTARGASAPCGGVTRSRVRDRFIMNREFDCQTCGACCASPYTGDAYVALDDGEAKRLTLRGLPVIFQQQGGDPPEFLPKLGTKLDAHATKVCAAFGGSVRSSCFCSIYEERPNACRQFDVGGNACREARRRMGFTEAHDAGSSRSSAPSSSSVSR